MRGWLKDKPYVALVYMTGILPIKKYGTHSALNLGYDSSTEEVFIPNQEITREYYNAITTTDWDVVVRALKQSEKLLQAVLAKDAEAVAKGIEEAHMETSHIQYNDENALSYTLSLAFYRARQKYKIFRELPTGKGYADLVFLPRPLHAEFPALVVELKWDKNANAAIQQIRNRQYGKALEDYAGKILVVGICYDREMRKHECLMEEYQK